MSLINSENNSQNEQNIQPLTLNEKRKSRLNEEEENECEQLIKIHLKIPNCSLMIEGYRTNKEKFYFCPCDPDCQNPLCYTCITKCHFSHWNKLNKSIDDIVTDKRNAVCNCGLKNHFVNKYNKNMDFIYIEQCQFLEWSIITKNYIYYEDENNPDQILCMFCYFLKNQPQNFIKKSDELLCRRLKCSNTHDDYLSIFEKLDIIVSNVPFKFEKLSEIQFLNMISKSSNSFENGFHKINNTLNLLKESILNEKKNQFDFNYYVNNSPFMKALESLCQIANICHYNYYPYQFIDIFPFIYQILKKKYLDNKSQKGIFQLKNNLLNLYHKLNFLKDFEIIPNLSIKDLMSLNPFQRLMYIDYINLFPKFEKKFFALNDKNRNYIDYLLLLLEKYNKMKNKDENIFEIIRRIFSECKIIIRFNKFTNEQYFKFFSLIDDIILNSLNLKDTSIKIAYQEMKMLSQMIKCIINIAYNLNDNILLKYLKGEITENDIYFFHSKNEIGKLIYRNSSHILYQCRNIHDLFVIKQKNKSKLSDSDNDYKIAKNVLYDKIDKLQNKIMFKVTEMTSLTLNSFDTYYYGLKRLLEKENSIIFYNYINNIFTEKEETIFDEMKEICIYLEKIYTQYYQFEITADQIEEEINGKIQEFFNIITHEDFVPPFKLLTENTQRNIFLNELILKTNESKNEENKNQNGHHIQILINKTPLLFTLNKSIEIILNGNIINQNHIDYFNSILKFYGYYVKDNPEHCKLFLCSKMLRTFNYIHIDYLSGFINLLHYIFQILGKSDIYIIHIKGIMKVIESLIQKINGKSKYINEFKMILKIISELSKLKFLNPEISMNKIRKTMKNIYKENNIFQEYKHILILSCQKNEENQENKSLSELIKDNEEYEDYKIKDLTELMIKFLKIINFLFDGNSTLNELEFLTTIFQKEEIPPILYDLTLDLSLRVELIRFYRISYIDVLIQSSKIKDYITLFANDINVNQVDQNFASFIFFQNLIKIKDTNLDMRIDCDLLNYELNNFGEIMMNNKHEKKNHIAKYFEEGIILPLDVFINKYISIIFNLDGNEYIKLYEIVLNFLETKKYIIEKGILLENELKNALNNKEGNIFSLLVSYNKYSLLMEKLKKKLNEELDDLNEDLNKLQDISIFEILNYQYIYNIFEKHITPFIHLKGVDELQKTYQKQTKSLIIEEIDEIIDGLKKKGEITNEFNEKINRILIKYENSKINYLDTSLCQNLTEKNVLFNTTYRSIILRPMFYLINNKKYNVKYRRQNLYHIFRLLQYDTQPTQDDIYKLRKIDIEKFKLSKKNQKIDFNEIIEMNNNIKLNDLYNKDLHRNEKKDLTNSSLIAINKKEVDGMKNKLNNYNLSIQDENNIEITFISNINLHYLVHMFMENLISIIFEKCNPSSFLNYEDYIIAYIIIKIMKYLCEDHNLNFQTLFFKKILIDTNEEELNIFDLMMCILNKLLILSKWDEITFDSNDSSIKYFYDIYFAIMEFSIEMIQGTSRENLLLIINNFERKDEKSYFFRLLYSSKIILMNNNNDNETLYKVRLDIMNFITAFVEERNTPVTIISLIENIYNPLSVFDCIVSNLKKLYLKIENKDSKQYNEIEFDNEKCEYFRKKYFENSEFSKNQEFELSNRMFYYVKELSFFDNKDAKNLFKYQNLYTTEQIIELRKMRANDLNDIDDSESVLVDSRFFQHYFVAKFFESITRQIWIRGEDKQSMMVLFTLEPSVQYLSENSKFEFYNNVPRDSRSSKLFSFMEHIDYFFIEIYQNKKKISNNCILKFINKINLSYLDIFIYCLTTVINLIIYSLAEYSDNSNHYNKLWKIIFPLGIIQLIITVISLIIWFVTKFNLYYKIAKQKYLVSHHLNDEYRLSFIQQLYIVILKTIFSKREMINFIWDFIFSILGILGPNFLFIYSIQLLIIVNISSTLQNITKAIAMRYNQLLTLILFLILAIFIFSTIAFFNFSIEFNKELQGNHENACGSLFYCFLTHIEIGLRTDGGIGEFIHKTSFLEDPAYFMGMFFFQFIFYLLIIVIMLSVVGGSIIDTFAELREKSQEDLNDMKNVCFICNGTRNDIEKKGEEFEEHCNNVHSIWIYLEYMIGLKFVDPQETNAINSFVIEQLNEKKISWFPDFNENDDGNEEINDDDE